ncbi:hypothetical protein IRJ41_011545 [Triplophysa rosa]|uniref:Uncharacterized protein n=1 Tax=Triplophysa rosa TaxID=992332 RepID=A0A9W7WR19_TRIRA|nr:hypothetical protein IRJ41_011545 [Triplophysa rosa]
MPSKKGKKEHKSDSSPVKEREDDGDASIMASSSDAVSNPPQSDEIGAQSSQNLDVIQKLELMRTDFATKIKGVLNAIHDVKKDVRDFSGRMDLAGERISSVEDTVNSEKSKLAEMDKRVESLSQKLDDLENRLRRSNLRLVNLPEKKTSTTMSCEHCGKKSSSKTNTVFVTTDFEQPMACGGARHPQIWEVDEETDCDKPTSKKASRSMKSEDFGKKSTPQMKPFYVTTDFAQPHGGGRRPQIWEVDDETDCDKPTSQLNNPGGRVVQRNMYMPPSGVMVRHSNNVEDGVESFGITVKKDGRIVRTEEITIYTT